MTFSRPSLPRPLLALGGVLVSLVAVWASAGGGLLAQSPFDSAVDVGVPSSSPGSLDAPGELDAFRFPASAGEALVLRVDLGSLDDSTLEIFSTDGASLAFNDDFDGLASQIRFNPPETADFFAVVGGFGDSAGSYTLVIEAAPEIALGAGPRFVDAGVSIIGDADGDGLGPSAIGDFDGDGVGDLGVGAPGALGGDGFAAAFAGPLQGTDLLPLGETAVSLGGLPGTNSGIAVAAGDLTNDGFNDFVVASIDGVELWQGGENFFANDFILFVVPIEEPFFTIDALAIADLNGDGVDDLALALPGPDSTAVGLYFGPFDVSDDANAVPASRGLIRALPDDFDFGRLLAAGDLTEDGQDDLAIVHTGISEEGFNLGPRVSVFPGPLASAEVDYDATEITTFVGFDVFFPTGIAIGDADLDDETDLLIGDDGLLLTIPARVVQPARFPAELVMLSEIRDLVGTIDLPFFGGAVLPAVGDVDGDRLPDVVVGVPQDELGGIVSGSVTVLPGAQRSTALYAAVPALVPVSDDVEVVLHGAALSGVGLELIPERGRPVRLDATDIVAESAGTLRLSLPGRFGQGVYGVRLLTADGEMDFDNVFELIDPTRAVTVSPGWDLLGWTGATPIGEALASFSGDIERALTWDREAQTFDSFNPAVPAAVNSLGEITYGQGIWLYSPSGGVWRQPIEPGSNVASLAAGFNLVMWGGPSVAIAEAVASLGDAFQAAFHWSAPSERFREYRANAPQSLRDNFPIGFGDAIWLQVSAPMDWLQPLPSAGLAPQPPLADPGPGVEHATVFIQNEFGSGSGFIISGNEILTNQHVVGGFRSVEIRFSDGTITAGFVAGVDSELDVAVVRVRTMPESARRLDWQTAPAPERGQEISSWGFPGGELFGEETSVTVSKGIIGAVRTEVDVNGVEGFSNLQIDLFIGPGSSGGPIVDNQGRLVGINDFSFLTGSFDLNFGIDVHAHRDRIWELLQRRN